MQQPTPTPPKHGSRVPRAGHSATLLTGLGALLAMVVLCLAVPRLSGHAHATATDRAPAAARSVAPVSAATSDSTVPAASDVFAGSERGALSTAQPPTF